MTDVILRIRKNPTECSNGMIEHWEVNGMIVDHHFFAKDFGMYTKFVCEWVIDGLYFGEMGEREAFTLAAKRLGMHDPRFLLRTPGHPDREYVM